MDFLYIVFCSIFVNQKWGELKVGGQIIRGTQEVTGLGLRTSSAQQAG